jgi:hypothetical protein
MANRIIDRADSAFLVRVNRQELDIGYLRCRVERLSLADRWLETWREAFPEAEPPWA